MEENKMLQPPLMIDDNVDDDDRYEDAAVAGDDDGDGSSGSSVEDNRNNDDVDDCDDNDYGVSNKCDDLCFSGIPVLLQIITIMTSIMITTRMQYFILYDTFSFYY